MCHLLCVRTLHLAHSVFVCQAECPHQHWRYMRQHCLWTFNVKCPTIVPVISRQQTDKQSNVVFVSTITNWHCTLLVLTVQNVRHHVRKWVWCVYNTGTLFYLTIHIITFTHTVSCNDKQWSAHCSSYLHESRSTHLVQHNAVNIMFLHIIFLQKVLKVFPSAHRHDSHLTRTLFIARYKFYRVSELMEKE